MTETKTENGHTATNRAHYRRTNTQRIRFVSASVIIAGYNRTILAPTTTKDGFRVLPTDSPLLR